ncbi:MAG: gliding motility-associated C-terminal domain-containing protein [Bacteroidota bacterium]
MDTSFWYFAGKAHLGSTLAIPPMPQDPKLKDELILTDPLNNQSGAAFYRRPIDISRCRRWTAEFDYRIWDGNGADGIAFCFLANPPFGYVIGGGLGTPPQPKGIMVLLDPWPNGNCYGTKVPKLEIAYGKGFGNYEECPPENIKQPTAGPLMNIRSRNYNHLTVNYDDGTIEVSINDSLILTGYYKVTFKAYFGITASTGGFNDRHSIKNFKITASAKPQPLELSAITDSTLTLLNWNGYESCRENSLKHYQIWRKLNNGDSVLIGITDPETTNWEAPTADAGQDQCYRIRAVENDDTTTGSNSNEVCVHFDYKLDIKNVLTPNGDGLNDTWRIPGIQQYPNSTVEVFNRWGKKVFEKRAYSEDWDAPKLPAGMYWYIVKINTVLMGKGWVDVVREAKE